MSKYTTGEMAKLCGVSVRTVQYYDSRNILNPSELSEGGRRLYSEDDLKRLKVICFLRSIDLPINTIGQLLAEENPEKVISLLLEQQAQTLREEIGQSQKKLQIIEELQQEIKAMDHFSVESIGDIAVQMEHKKKLHRLYAAMIAICVPVELIGIGMLILGIRRGIWWPLIVDQFAEVVIAVLISVYYFRRVAYICPECHEIFRPNFKEAFWARHTLRTRRLTCPACGKKGFCVETHRSALQTEDGKQA